MSSKGSKGKGNKKDKDHHGKRAGDSARAGGGKRGVAEDDEKSLKQRDKLREAGFMVVDGSLHEGGGQILRNSCSYAGILGKKIHVYNIRANRPNPGLANQHATGICFVHQFYGGKLEDCYVKSTSITFEPGTGTFKPSFVADTKSAGSTALLVQVLLPCVVFGAVETRLRLKGGTNAIKAPQFDYIQLVFAPMMKKLFDLDIQTDMVCRGFFPRGGGEISMNITPKQKLEAFTLTERGIPESIEGIALVAGNQYSSDDADVMAASARSELEGYFPANIPIDIRAVHDPKSSSPGTGAVLTLKTSTGCLLGGDALGGRETPRKVGEEAAKELIRAWKEGGCVDEWLQDQLIIYMALAEGRSEFLSGPVSLHTKTAIYCAEQLTSAKFSITPVSSNQEDEDDDEKKKQDSTTNLIVCEAMGFHNPNL